MLPGSNNRGQPAMVNKEHTGHVFSRFQYLLCLALLALPTTMWTVLRPFPSVKCKDEAAHGEHRTKRVILEIYDAMQRAMETGEPYQTLLDPPPADPRVAHPE